MNTSEKPVTGARRAPRDPEQTRRLILDAAIELLLKTGRPATLERVAAAAGVSKGGLLHHFGSQEDLAAGMCRDSMERLWQEVQALIEVEDEAPGRLLRAYVLAILGEDSRAATALAHSAALLLFRDIDVVRHLYQADAQMWREAFEADGVSPDQWMVVRFATEGVVPSLGTPYLSPSEHKALRTRLLELAEATKNP